MRIRNHLRQALSVLVALTLLFSAFCAWEDIRTRGKPGRDAAALAPVLLPGMEVRGGELTERDWLPLYERRTGVSLVVRGGWRTGASLLERRQVLDSDIRLLGTDPASLPRFTPPDSRGRPEREAAVTWGQLAEMPAHARVRLAFSTRRPVSPEGLLHMLSAYRLRVEWMPVWEESRPRPDRPVGIYADGEGGITPANLPRRHRSLLRVLQESRPLRWMGVPFDPAAERKAIAAGPLRVYGAVVDGSAEEVLRLRGMLELRHPEIMEAGLW